MKSNIFKIFGTTEAKSGSASSEKPVVPDKEAARNCLALADQHIKEGRYEKARVEHSLRREVKLEMYGRAVKEAIAKRDLVRSSSFTLEWLRKVYDVTLDEYLKYESKFLTDLVADQYRGSILLVSSDPAVRDNTTARLKSLGYAVVVASTPDEALEKIEKIHPQFILCDTDFPQGRLSGIKFLHVLRGNPKFNYLPFILFCEHSSVSEIESSELRSSEGYVRKPVQFEELTDVMEKKLAKFKEYISSLSS